MRALWLLAVSSTIVGCLDDNKPAREPEAETKTPVAEPSRRAPEPKPQVAQAPKVDLSMGEGFEMRRPIKDGRLTIIPIITTRAVPMQKFVTLQDGMRRGMVSVREVGGSDEWEVDTVRVTNSSNEPLVILEGELIEDAMQDRITAENVVIDPHKTQRISVRCVEEDRDHGGITFHAGNAMAEFGLRRTLVHQSQESVWSKVKQINAREKLYPKTNTYRLAAHAQLKGDAGARRDRLVKQLEGLEERPNIVGFAVAIDGQVVAIDRFASPDLYRQLEGQLLASYMPATGGDQPTEGQRIAPDQVRALLSSTTGSQSTAVKTVIKSL
jgi:hypothetical protein